MVLGAAACGDGRRGGGAEVVMWREEFGASHASGAHCSVLSTTHW
jgi:hypothetical protein